MASATKTAAKNGETKGEVNLQPGAAAAKGEGETLVLESIQVGRLKVDIVGLSPLIMHNWSDKAKATMLRTKQNKPQIKEPCDPQAEYLASMYRMAAIGEDGLEDPDIEPGYGMPASAFHQATVGAARFYGKDVPMTALRQFIFMEGRVTSKDPQPLVEIFGEPHMREDPVRLTRSSTDLRYRACFSEWEATLDVMFVATSINRDSVLSLIEAGGMGVGVGDWRPERGGNFGKYALTGKVEVVS